MRRMVLARAVGSGLTVVVAGVVGILGVFNQVGQEMVSAATLAVLAAVSAELAVSWRHSQAADESVQGLASAVEAQTSRPSLDRIVERAVPGSWTAEARHARLICVVGVTLSRTIRTALPELEWCLAGGGTVHVAVPYPGGATKDDNDLLLEATRRHGLADDSSALGNRLDATLETLGHLAHASDRGHLEVRYLPFVPNVCLVLIDPDAPNGRGHVDVYAHRPGAHEPCLSLSCRREPEWFAHFTAEFDQLWAAGRTAFEAPHHPPRGSRALHPTACFTAPHQ